MGCAGRAGIVFVFRKGDGSLGLDELQESMTALVCSLFGGKGTGSFAFHGGARTGCRQASGVVDDVPGVLVPALADVVVVVVDKDVSEASDSLEFLLPDGMRGGNAGGGADEVDSFRAGSGGGTLRFVPLLALAAVEGCGGGGKFGW